MSRYGDGAVINGDGQVVAQQNPPFIESYLPSPADPYAASKVYVENFIKAMQRVHNFTYTIWVPHNAFSPRQYVDPYRNFLAIWMNLILMGKDCYIYGNGDQRRAISWVDDYNPIICESLFNPNTYNQTINIVIASC
jgi:UDP-glucose 4-epimerase